MAFYTFGHSETLPESDELADAATASPEGRAQLLRAAGLDSNPAIDPRTTRARQTYVETVGEDLILRTTHFSIATPVEKYTGHVPDEAVIIFGKARNLGLTITIHRAASGECLATGMLNDCTFLLGQWGWPASGERMTAAKIKHKMGWDEANEYRRTRIATGLVGGLAFALNPILNPNVSLAYNLSFWVAAGLTAGCAYTAYARLGRTITIVMRLLASVSVIMAYSMMVLHFR